MKLPIIAYGDSVLRKKGLEISKDYPEMNSLIENMFETMYGAHGIGLAAPQIGLSIRLFIIDATSFAEDEPALKDFKKTFINAKILEESGIKWSFNEGCLSIPEIREAVDHHHERLARIAERRVVNLHAVGVGDLEDQLTGREVTLLAVDGDGGHG